MNGILCGIIGVLLCVIGGLCWKIRLLRISARQIGQEFHDRLNTNIKNTKILNILKNKYILMYLEENNLRSFLKNFNINLFKTKNKKNIELIQFLLIKLKKISEICKINNIFYLKKLNKKNKHMFIKNNYLYIEIEKIIKTNYFGYVYNYEVEDKSHTFCCPYMIVHNCDPSRGTSEDRTAIEIIDMDGRDDNGFPIIEQVGEYVGKRLGDDIGSIIYQYGKLYNDAFVVADATGGQADALLLTLINMGYKNLYYEDNSQKTYTLQNQFNNSADKYTDKLPGFHFQGNRYAVLSNFASLVRNNEFKIRSVRVINELDTWIFKGENARMDHMAGSHDDTITALAMGLFVMQYSLNKLQELKNKDEAILSSYLISGGINYRKMPSNSIDMRPNKQYQAPFYKSTKSRYSSSVQGNFMWLFGGRK